MKKLLCLLLGSLCLTAWGQFDSPQLETYEPADKKVRRKMFRYMVANHGLYAILPSPSSSRKLIVRKTDHLLNWKGENEIDLTVGKSVPKMEKVLAVGPKLLLFTSMINRKSKMQRVMVQEIDTESLTLVGERETLGAVPVINVNTPAAFQFRHSDDSSKVLAYVNHTGKFEEEEAHSLFVINQDLQLLWSHTEKLPYKEGLLGIQQIVLSNTGDVALSAVKSEIVSQALFTARTALREIKFFVYRNEGQEQQEYNYEQEDVSDLITQYKMDFTKDGKLVVGGFYVESGSRLFGTFLMHYAPEQAEPILNSFNRWTATEKYEIREIENYFGGFALKKMILRQDGGVVVVGEYRSREEDQRYYGNILIVNTDGDGEVEWARTVPKFQRSATLTHYLSYQLMVQPDRLSFFFTDHIRNHEPGQGQVYNFGGGELAVITLATVGLDGTMEKEILMGPRKYGIFLLPRYGFQTSSRTAYLRTKHRMHKVVFVP